MMKKIVFSVLLLTGVMQMQAQDRPFVLQGKIKGQNSGKIKLYYESGNGYKQDSAAIRNGAFEIKGTLTAPTMAYIAGAVKSQSMDDPNSTSLFLEPGKMSLELTAGDFRNLRLTGSKTQNEYKEVETLKENVMTKLKPILADYNRANEIYIEAMKAKKPEAEQEALKMKANAVKDKMNPYHEELSRIDRDYIKSHPDSYYSAYAFRYMTSNMPVSEARLAYEKFSDRIKESSYGKAIAEEIKKMEAGSPGAVAASFTATDIDGKLLNLADFKGKKYVLLDFWASWCVPCRQGNPHLLSLYSNYKDKGLEIIGISDDDGNQEAWRKAVAKDGIGVWKHILRGLKRTSSGYDRSNDISEGYGIHSLPTKILIDKNGVIIGRYGGGGENDEAMDKKMAEIFNN